MRSSPLHAALWLVVGIGAGLVLTRLPHVVLGHFADPGRTRIDQAAVLERLQSAASLITTEVTVRDVVTFSNTRFGSTKRTLVVVTGRALVGFDLKRQATARIDEPARRVRITLPHAALVGVDVAELKTYDESRGLWNPFHPEDRDTIYQLARARLAEAAQELEVVSHAETGAKGVLTALFASSGYSVDIEFVPFLAPPAAR